MKEFSLLVVITITILPGFIAGIADRWLPMSLGAVGLLALGDLCAWKSHYFEPMPTGGGPEHEGRLLSDAILKVSFVAVSLAYCLGRWLPWKRTS